MTELYRSRIAKIKKILKSQGPAALILGSAPVAVRSNDTEYRYRQDSNFFYLSGSHETGLILCITSIHPRPYLLCEPENKHRTLWEGPRASPAKLAATLGAELKESSDIRMELRKLIAGTETLYYQNTKGSESRKFADELLNAPAASMVRMPKRFCSADSVLESLRIRKDRYELDAIEQASRVSAAALQAALPQIRAGAEEWQVTAAITGQMAANRCEEAFTTIVASGPRAAILHYVKGEGRLRQGELLLIDWGAEHQLYGSDVTRVLPVNGVFSPSQRLLYQTVLRAQKAAIAAIRDGVLIKNLYNAAARELTKGLRELKVLKGPLPKLLKEQAYREYFPHGIGHSVGLDIHDLGPFRGNKQARLQTGMVFTIEPGLYFAKPAGVLPACGVRIEDTVLVTKSGCRVLTAAIPKEIHEIEKLMRRRG